MLQKCHQAKHVQILLYSFNVLEIIMQRVFVLEKTTELEEQYLYGVNILNSDLPYPYVVHH